MGSASGSAARGGRAGDQEQSGQRREAQRPNGDLPARVVFAALVLASFAAFFVTQRLKHTPTAVQRVQMTTVFRPAHRAPSSCRGPVPRRLVGATKRLEYLSFKIAQADEVTVEIVDFGGGEVAAIVHDLALERYKQLSLCWNGHRGATQRGRLAPPGEYRIRVTLRHQGRTVYPSRSFTLQAPGA
jgi:hypothetical protein